MLMWLEFMHSILYHYEDRFPALIQLNHYVAQLIRYVHVTHRLSTPSRCALCATANLASTKTRTFILSLIPKTLHPYHFIPQHKAFRDPATIHAYPFHLRTSPTSLLLPLPDLTANYSALVFYLPDHNPLHPPPSLL